MAIGISSTNRVQHAKVRESSYGVTPASPVFKQMRVTSSSLNAGPTTVVSDEIRADRQVADLILVGLQARGDIGAELSFNSSDDDLEEVLQGAWTNAPNFVNSASNTPISALSSTTATVASGGAAFLTGMIAVLSGFPTAANNNAPKIVASSSGTTVVFPASSFTAETGSIPVGAQLHAVGFACASGDLVATSTGLTSTTLDFTTLPLVVGSWIKLGGTATGNKFATAVDNDWCRISAISAHATTFDRKPSGWTTDSGTGKTVYIWFGDRLRNGTTQYSNTIERQYLDQASVSYEYLTGMCLDSMSLAFQTQQIVKITNGYIGASGSVSASRVSGATDLAAPSYSVMNATANIGRIAVAGAVLPGQNFVTEASIDIKNNQRPLYAVGSLGAVGVGNGEFTVTGKLATYFADATVFNYVLNNTAVSFDFRVQDSANPFETILFDMPRIKFATGAPAVPGKNQNVMIDATYQAVRDPTLGYTLHVQRHWYFEV